MSCARGLLHYSDRRTYDVILPAAMDRPDVKNPEIGAQNSTGMGSFRQFNFMPVQALMMFVPGLGMTDTQIASGASLKRQSQGTRSQNFLEKREQNDKTSKFLNYSGIILNFK